ncbi:MAG: hypothetical protein LBG92_05705 [Prevotellaceae bacterium]|jgi:hypothetical protein|nr:hypothetical protein [Prevotellaceae bacterium]
MFHKNSNFHNHRSTICEKTDGMMLPESKNFTFFRTLNSGFQPLIASYAVTNVKDNCGY